VTPGTCASPLDVGGACVPMTGEVAVTGCATGLDCVGGHCAVPPTSGPCGPQGDCKTGFFCTYTGSCAAQKPAGAPCGQDAECAGHAGCASGVCKSLDCIEPSP
jgi:hypothetical protein